MSLAQLKRQLTSDGYGLSTIFLTKEALGSQDFVFKLIQNQVVAKKMLPWATEEWQRFCSPGVETTNIRNAEDFSRMLKIVTSSIQENMEKNAKDWLTPVRNLQVAKKISPEQSSLALRARNIGAMFVSNYLLTQWQFAAFFSIFIRIVEDEVLADNESTAFSPLFNSFYICEDGYTRDYQRGAKASVTIGDQVQDKLLHAGFGRWIIWAHKLYQEMKKNLELSNVYPHVFYSPIYLQMQTSKMESVSSVLEFFMRMMYISTVGDVAALFKREKSQNLTNSASELEVVSKYFNISIALVHQFLPTDILKRSKTTNDNDDNDDDLVAKDDDPFGEKTNDDDDNKVVKGDQFLVMTSQHKLCGSLTYALPCFPHQTTLPTTVEMVSFSSLFATLENNNGSLFGDLKTARESSRCIWVVWLQNIEKLWAIFCENQKETIGSGFSTLGTSKERLQAAICLLTCTPKPVIISHILSMLRQSIERHCEVLLHDTGFDLNYHGLVDRLVERIGLLSDFYSIVNVTMLEQHFLEQQK